MLYALISNRRGTENEQKYLVGNISRLCSPPYWLSAGGNAPFVNLPEDEQVVVLNATVGENGKFSDVTFPSGTSIKCSEGLNLQEGTELTFDERKTTLNGVSTLLYSLNASLDSVNITNSIEHPLIVTILNNSDSGTAYIGLRNNQNDPQPRLDTYTITLDLNGGTLNNTTIEYTAETEEFNLPTPTKTGYTFIGWTGFNGDTPQTFLTIAKGSTGDRTYTANFVDEYKITYNLSGGTTTNPATYSVLSGQ